MSIARDLGIDHEEAQGWCEAWERFAARHGVARGRYFWDSARGWIDAQRSFEKAERSAGRSSLVTSRVALEPPVATARRVDQGP
jgi:hypothetical protein